MFESCTSSNSDFRNYFASRNERVEKDEIEKYENSAIDINVAPFDLLAFWKTNEYVYPTLSKIAKRILCILPTSCPSERVYSVCDTVITKKRNRMQQQNN